MNEIDIDLSNTRNATPVEKERTPSGDPWTEAIEGNVLTVTLDKPWGSTTRISASFGEGAHFKTLEALRTHVRTTCAYYNATPAEALARDTAWAKQRERAEETQYAVMRAVIEKPGMTSRDLSDHMHAEGWKGTPNEIRTAVEELAETMDVFPMEQPLHVEIGARSARFHYPGKGHTAAMWSEAERLINTAPTAEEVQRQTNGNLHRRDQEIERLTRENIEPAKQVPRPATGPVDTIQPGAA